MSSRPLHYCSSCHATLVRTPRSVVCLHCFAHHCAHGDILSMGSLDDLIRSGEALASGSIKSGMATEEILRGILQAVNIGKIDFDVDDDEKRSKMVRRKVAKLVDILVRISSTLLSELTAVDCEMLLREYIAESVVLRRLVLGLLHEWSPHASTMTPWLRTISHHRSPLLSDCLEGPMDEHLLELLNVVVDVVHSIDVDDPQALWFIDFDLAYRLVDALPPTKESPLMIEALKLLVRLSRDDHSLTRLFTAREGCIAPPCEIIDFRNRLSTGLTSILASELATEMIQVDSLQCALTLLSPNDAHPSEDTAHHKPCEWGVELLSSSNKPDVVAAASHCVLSFLCADSALASRLSSCVCQGALGSLLKAVGQHPSTVEPLAEVVLLTGPSQVRCLPNMVRAGAALARMNHLPRSHRILQMAADCCSLLNSPDDATELLISVVDSVRSGIDIALVMPCLGAAIDLHPSLPPDEGIKVVHTLLEASANARSVKEGVALCAKLVEQLGDNNICPEIRKLFINSPELRLAILSVDGGGRLAKLVLTGSLPAGLLSSSLEGVSRLPTATHWQLALAMSPQLDRSVAVCLLAWLFFDVYECGGHIEALLAPTGSFNRSEMDFNVALLLASLHASLDQSPQGACLIELLSTASFSWEAEECTLHSTEVIIDTIVFLAADVDGIDALTCRRLMDVMSELISRRPELERDRRIVEVVSRCLHRGACSIEQESEQLIHAMRKLIATVPGASLDLSANGPAIIKALSSTVLTSATFTNASICDGLLHLLSHCLMNDSTDTTQSRIVVSMLRSCVHDIARRLCSSGNEVLSPVIPVLLKVCTQASFHHRADPDPYVIALAEMSESRVHGTAYLLSISALPSSSSDLPVVPPTENTARAQWCIQWAQLLLVGFNSGSRIDAGLIQASLVPACETVAINSEKGPCPAHVVVSAVTLWVTLRALSEEARDALVQEAALNVIVSNSDCSRTPLLVLILSIVVDPPLWLDLPSFVHKLVQPLINEVTAARHTAPLARRILREVVELELLPLGAVPVVMRLLGKSIDETEAPRAPCLSWADDWVSTTCIVLADKLSLALVEGSS